MGGVAVVILSFALLVAALFLFLLAELYYTFVLKSRFHLPTAAPVDAQTTAVSPSRDVPSSSGSPPGDGTKLFPNGFYAQGVFGNPGFLFSIKEETLLEEAPDSPSSIPSNLHFIGLHHPPKASPSTSLLETSTSERGDGEYVCISNPIYEVSVTISAETTPFETPVSSPSKLDGFSGDDPPSPESITPPLTPMKLTGTASSAFLADKSLASSSCSECSSSGSRCTSPSW